MKASVAQQQAHVDHHPEEDDYFWTANGNNKKGLILCLNLVSYGSWLHSSFVMWAMLLTLKDEFPQSIVTRFLVYDMIFPKLMSALEFALSKANRNIL